VRIILLLCLLFFVPLKEKHWKKYAFSPGCNYFYETTTIKINEDGNFIVWKKDVPYGDSLLSDRKMLKFPTYSYTVVKTEIECEIGKLRSKEIYFYDDKGNVLRELDHNNDAEPWMHPPERTVGRDLISAICKIQ